MTGEFERLAYEAALRGLDKQEGLLEELRTRTGMLLAASSLAASFLGQQAFGHPHPTDLAVIALLAFVVTIGASVLILIPNDNLYFSEAGSGLYQGLYTVREDIAEVYRRLGYELDRFWESNNRTIVKLTRTYKVAAGSLVLEIVSLAALLGGTIL
jgi:hypothetical protein